VEDTSLDEDEQFGLWTDGEGRTETESKRGAARRGAAGWKKRLFSLSSGWRLVGPIWYQALNVGLRPRSNLAHK
jgi:hypothetical protein